MLIIFSLLHPIKNKSAVVYKSSVIFDLPRHGPAGNQCPPVEAHSVPGGAALEQLRVRGGEAELSVEVQGPGQPRRPQQRLPQLQQSRHHLGAGLQTSVLVEWYFVIP